MRPFHLLAPVSALLLVSLAACGGETIGSGDGTNGQGSQGGSGSGSGESGGGGTSTTQSGVTVTLGGGGSSGSSGSSGSTGSTGSGGQCIDVAVGAGAVTCSQDSDCTLIPSGEICNDSCNCPSTAVNSAAASAYESLSATDLPPPPEGTSIGCACPAAFTPQCLGGQCVSCNSFGGGPDACSQAVDAGTTTIVLDASAPPPTEDAGTTSTVDGGVCVDIDLSTYDTSCQSDSDCVYIQGGEVCSGDCACGTTYVNVSGEQRYEQAIDGIATGACACPAQFPAACVDNQCKTAVP